MSLEISKIKLQLQALHLLIMLMPEANRDTAKVSSSFAVTLHLWCFCLLNVRLIFFFRCYTRKMFVCVFDDFLEKVFEFCGCHFFYN